MEATGIKPIREKFLLPNYLLALEFKEGFVFARVIRRRICCYKPYRVIDSNGQQVVIAPLSYTPELTVNDPRNIGRDILYLDSSTNSGYPWILHGSIGIKPQYIYMYPRFPLGQEIPGRFPNIDPIRPEYGDDVGYINSELSPYSDPSDYVEYVIPPKQKMGIQYYNKDFEKPYQPVLNVLFAVYWMQILSPERDRELISSIATRKVPAAFLTVGWGNSPLELGHSLAVDWNAKPMSIDEAASL